MPSPDPERRREYRRRWYANNRRKQMDAVNRRRKEIREEVKTYKSTTPCADCKKTYPHYVMDFDHVRGKKSYNISDKLRVSPSPSIWKEIVKCEVVCANCHRERTYHQSVARWHEQHKRKLKRKRKRKSD